MKWNYKLICSLLLFCFAKIACSQMAPTIQYQSAFGGTMDDGANSIINLPNGKLMVAGFTASNDGDVLNLHDHHEFWIFQLDSNLNLERSKTYGGSFSEFGESIKKCSDGGFILIGYASSSDGDVVGLHGGFADQDIWIVKLDSLLNIEWQYCLGGTLPDYGYDVELTSDGGYFLVGEVESFDGDIQGNHGDDFWVCKLDSLGNKVWCKCLGGYSIDRGLSCIQTLDGSYLVTGITLSNDSIVTDNHGGTADSWVVKLDAQGNILWTKCYGGTGIDNGEKIIPTWDNGFYLISSTNSQDGDVGIHPGNTNMWLVKADSSGTILWQKTYGQVSEGAYCAVRTSDGGIAMAGYSNCTTGPITVNHGSDDFAVIKVDSLGNFEWGNAFGGSESEEVHSICETSGHNLVLAGYTLSNDQDVTNFHGGINHVGDAWVVKLSPLPLSVSENEYTFMNISIFQNNDQLNLRFFSKHNENAKVSLYDINGKQLVEKNISVNEGINFNQISCSDFAKGMYVLKIEGERNSMREKIFIE